MTTINNRYELVKPIGKGGLAEVYLARDLNNKMEVALKLLDPIKIEHNPDLIRRLRNEMRAVESLHHPHIIKLLGAGSDGSQNYIVLAYMPNGTLAAAIRRRQRPYTLDEAIALLHPIADALDAVHAARMVHRDIKPSNILFDERNRPILADFNLVHGPDDLLSATDATRQAARGGRSPGTPGYSAPEQIDHGEGAIGPQTDLFAFALIMCEMLQLKAVIGGDTQYVTIHGDRERWLAPLRLGDSARALFLRALSRKPDERPAQVGAWLQDLAATLAAHANVANAPNAPTTVLEAARLHAEGRKAHAEGRFTDAIRFKSEAIKLDPDNPAYYDSRSHSHHTAAHRGLERNANYAAALRDATRAINLAPRDARYYHSRGVTYQTAAHDKSQHGNYQKALADKNRAIELDPGNALYCYSRAVSYHEAAHHAGSPSDNYDRALSDYTRAIELDPAYADAYFGRGRIFAARRQTQQARRDFERAHQLGHPDAEQRLAKLG